MNKDNIKTEIIVKDRKIGVLRIGNKEYISLTDLEYIENKVNNKQELQIKQ